MTTTQTSTNGKSRVKVAGQAAKKPGGVTTTAVAPSPPTPIIKALPPTKLVSYDYDGKLWAWDTALPTPAGATGLPYLCWPFNVSNNPLEPSAVLVVEVPASGPPSTNACSQAICPDGPNRPNKNRPAVLPMLLCFAGGVNAGLHVILYNWTATAIVLNPDNDGSKVGAELLTTLARLGGTVKPGKYHVYGVPNLPGFEGTDSLVAIPVA
jgi:hypothetical protein